MAWEPSFIDDGDTADSGSITDRFDAAKTWIDDIGRAGLRRGVFGRFHAPVTGVLPTTGTYSISNNTVATTYVRAVFLGSIDYTTFGANGGSTDAGDLGSGDRAVLGHVTAGGIGQCSLALPGSGFKVGMANGDRVGAMLVRLNAELKQYTHGAGVETYMWAMTCLQFRLNGAGTWYTIDGSERFTSLFSRKLDGTSSAEKVDVDMCTTTLITEAMVGAVGAPATDAVSHVRAMVSMYTDADNTASMTFHKWNMTVLPIHCSYTAV